MIKYFFNTEYKSRFYGNIKLSQFKKQTYNPPEFIGKIEFNEIPNMNKTSLATIIIGDKKYNGHFFTQRILEALRDGLIIFIDNDYDNKHILFKDYHYVKNKYELNEKIKEIKNNIHLRAEILSEQHKLYEKFSKEFFELNCIHLLERLGK